MKTAGIPARRPSEFSRYGRMVIEKPGFGL
jgi:hypothetical protein